MSEIQAGTTITLHFELTGSDRRVIESTYQRGEPVRCTLGDGTLPETFEACLLGLKAGAKEQWQLAPEQAFGEPNPGRIMHFNRGQFGLDMPIEVGMVMGFSQPNGDEMPGIIRTIEGDSVTVDFNHPLAGERIGFAVEILSIDEQ